MVPRCIRTKEKLNYFLSKSKILDPDTGIKATYTLLPILTKEDIAKEAYENKFLIPIKNVT